MFDAYRSGSGMSTTDWSVWNEDEMSFTQYHDDKHTLTYIFTTLHTNARLGLNYRAYALVGKQIYIHLLQQVPFARSAPAILYGSYGYGSDSVTRS